MSDPNIPPEAFEAALPFAAACAYYCKPSANDCQCRQNLFRAIQAALRNWPGMTFINDEGGTKAAAYLPLPLSQEPTND